MIDVNTHAAKTRLSHLLALVETKGERIRLCRNGKPVAMLVPIENTPVDPLTKHPELTGIVFYSDPVEPIDEEDWPQEAR